MLEVEDAVEVVDLMAEGASEIILGFHFEPFAFGVLGFHGDELRTDNIAAKAWNREATLFFALFAFGVDDFRIDENDFGFGILAGGDIDYGDANALANLRGSQAG